MTDRRFVAAYRALDGALGCAPRTMNRVAKALGGWAALRAKAADEDVLGLPLVPAGHRVKGVSTMARLPDGRLRWVKTAEDHEQREEMIAALLADLPTRVPAREGAIPFGGLGTDEDLLAIYPMGDPHIGMLSWAPETGANFDLDLAIQINRRAIDHLAALTPRARKALIVNLGDFFHADDARNVTPTSGHALDVDGRRAKILQAGLDLMIYLTDRALEAHEEVTVDTQIGNHDSDSALTLAIGLHAYYRHEPRVSILRDPNHYHVHQWGRCLIGTHHGHGAKIPKLPGYMAARWSELWGKTTFRRWYTGHIHHRKVEEFPGVVVESFNTLAPADAWHAGEGYLSERNMTRITLDRRGWESHRSTVSADMLAYLYREQAARG